MVVTQIQWVVAKSQYRWSTNTVEIDTETDISTVQSKHPKSSQVVTVITRCQCVAPEHIISTTVHIRTTVAKRLGSACMFAHSMNHISEWNIRAMLLQTWIILVWNCCSYIRNFSCANSFARTNYFGVNCLGYLEHNLRPCSGDPSIKKRALFPLSITANNLVQLTGLHTKIGRKIQKSTTI